MMIFPQGVLIGLGMAAPVGPVALLCIRTTLSYGRGAGFAAGAGAAFADSFYAAVGVFGVSLVLDFLQDYSVLVRLLGGFFLITLGVKMMLAPALEGDGVGWQKTMSPNLVKDFVTTFFVTLTNPGTIFAFIAVFAALGIRADGDYERAASLVAGVLLGSLSWWLLLSFSISLFKKKMQGDVVHKINMASGGMIAVFGGLILLTLLKNSWFQL